MIVGRIPGFRTLLVGPGQGIWQPFDRSDRKVVPSFVLGDLSEAIVEPREGDASLGRFQQTGERACRILGFSEALMTRTSLAARAPIPAPEDTKYAVS